MPLVRFAALGRAVEPEMNDQSDSSAAYYNVGCLAHLLSVADARFYMVVETPLTLIRWTLAYGPSLVALGQEALDDLVSVAIADI
ncbi:hypothetical protein QFC20_002888 [Naganishia adeliensis]|uniref:Uncharacterized protein n=1 Tax=Naganishia adeliensis TaxID=92952 RepID=A0ACC2WFM4_9TREE|nr:hypothetical protein QFC20_002888 [Naganishia adeliensis]